MADIRDDFVKRPVTSFRIREDFVEKVNEECRRLNCSKGVYFELLLSKAWEAGEITTDDVFQYNAGLRWLHDAISPQKAG